MSKLIAGVKVRELNPIPDERGWLMEIMRSDWEEFETFGQVYVTTVHPGIVKAWHMHKHQWDHFVCIRGKVKVALYDDREESETHRMVNEFFIGERNYKLIKIPPKVYHGFKGIGEKTAYVVNVPDKLYNYEDPDEYRLEPDTDKIEYDWILPPGKKHG